MNYQNKVLTQRNFTSVKEDPAAAAKASHLTRQYLKNEDYLEMAKDLQSKLDSQEDSVYQVVKYAEELLPKSEKNRSTEPTWSSGKLTPIQLFPSGIPLYRA